MGEGAGGRGKGWGGDGCGASALRPFRSVSRVVLRVVPRPSSPFVASSVAPPQAAEAQFRAETIGLVTREEYASKQASLDERAAAGRKRQAAEAVAAEAERVRAAADKVKRARAAERAKLSFGGADDEDEDEEGAGEDDGGGAGGAAVAPPRPGGLLAGLGKAPALGLALRAASGGAAGAGSGGVGGEGSGATGAGSTGGGGGGGGEESGAAGGVEPGGRGSGEGGAGAVVVPRAPASKPLLKVGKDPTVRSDFLPDREREVREAVARERLAKEWAERQEALKAEPLEISYSFWNGTGHRRATTVKKGDTVGKFLAKALEEMRPRFRELRAVDAGDLMYVKEDVILPDSMTFYELIAARAQGRSGPLFTFDLREHVTIRFDPRQRSQDSHAGKVVERHWYAKNKHIFPVNKWENFDPEKHIPKDDN